MSVTLTVLLENGRRQRVTTRNTSSISEILEEVCQKQKLNSDKYDIQYKNRTLSISSTLDFYHIPNNAQLSLILLQKEREMLPVQIFLQMEDGKRYSGTFIPTDSLWHVIITLCPEDITKKKNPVIIYLRKEIFHENLKTTTLRSLGLIGCSVLFRLLHRTAEQLGTQCVAPPLEKKFKKSKKEEHKDDRPFFKKIIDKIETTTTEIFADKPKEDVETKVNVVKEEIKNLKPNIESKVDSMETPMDIDENNVPTQDNASNVGEISSSCVSNVTLPSFVTQSYIDGIEYIGERNALAFRLDNMSTPKFQDPTDDFYKLTIDDAKLLIRDAKESRKEMETSEFSTNAMREKKRLERIQKIVDRYAHCVVRIQFQNRTVLQGIFKSDESIEDVVKFVRNFLKNSNTDFFLYTSPPKTVLNSENRLYELGIPGLLVYFGTNDSNKNNSIVSYLDDEIMKKLISSDVAQNVANFFRNQMANGSSQNIPLITTVVQPTQKPTVSRQHSSTASTSSSNTNQRVPSNTKSSSNQNKVPKWFKKMF